MGTSATTFQFSQARAKMDFYCMRPIQARNITSSRLNILTHNARAAAA